MKSYIAGTLSTEPGEKFAKMCQDAGSSAEAESERQRNLAQSNPQAYQQEGLVALASLAADGDGCVIC